MQIVSRAGFDRFPLPLLVSGSILDSSEEGAFAALSRAVDARSSRFSDPHPLYSTAFYLLANEDVAVIDAAPWVHYQAFGVLEGRSPHPLLDVTLMREWLPTIPRQTIVDEYLADPALWMIETSAYVDSQRFLLEAVPQASEPPLLRILQSGAIDDWVSLRLMLIDGSSTKDAVARMNAGAFLTTRHTRPGVAGRLVDWAEGPSRASESLDRITYTVVPGYFLGANGSVIVSVGSDAASPDSTMLRLPHGYLSIASGPEIDCDRLVFVTAAVSRETAAAALSGANGRVVVSPRSRGQALAFGALAAQLGVEDVIVLPAGAQAAVTASSVTVLDEDPVEPSPWSWDERIAPADVLFLLPVGLASVAPETVERILVWVGAGASALTVDDAFVSRWRGEFDRPHVVLDSSLVELARVLVDDRSLWAIAEPR